MYPSLKYSKLDSRGYSQLIVIVLRRFGAASSTAPIAVWLMANHLRGDVSKVVKGASSGIAVGALMLLNLFALDLIMLCDIDDAAGNDCFLDEAHCDLEV